MFAGTKQLKNVSLYTKIYFQKIRLFKYESFVFTSDNDGKGWRFEKSGRYSCHAFLFTHLDHVRHHHVVLIDQSA